MAARESRNELRLVGLVGAIPDVRQFDNGSAIAYFSIATTEKWTDGTGKEQKHTEWHKIRVPHEGVGFVVGNVQPGACVYVLGSLRTREFEIKGKKRRVTEVWANEMSLLSPAKEKDNAPSKQPDFRGGVNKTEVVNAE